MRLIQSSEGYKVSRNNARGRGPPSGPPQITDRDQNSEITDPLLKMVQSNKSEDLFAILSGIHECLSYRYNYVRNCLEVYFANPDDVFTDVKFNKKQPTKKFRKKCKKGKKRLK